MVMMSKAVVFYFCSCTCCFYCLNTYTDTGCPHGHNCGCECSGVCSCCGAHCVIALVLCGLDCANSELALAPYLPAVPFIAVSCSSPLASTAPHSLCKSSSLRHRFSMGTPPLPTQRVPPLTKAANPSTLEMLLCLLNFFNHPELTWLPLTVTVNKELARCLREQSASFHYYEYRTPKTLSTTRTPPTVQLTTLAALHS